MIGLAARFSLVGATILSLAGCPVPNDARNTFDYTGSTGRSTVGGDSSAAAGPNADQLETQFADCRMPTDAGTLELEVLRLVNRERSRRGLSTLSLSSTLQSQAAAYACELIHYDYFAHVNPVTGSTLAQRATDFDYDYLVVGENLAAGQSTPDRAMEDWMASPGHAANILSPEFTEVGIAVRVGGDYGIYWVQEFGEPAPTQLAGPVRKTLP